MSPAALSLRVALGSLHHRFPLAGPGISSYADDPAGAGASLKPCLDRAMKIVPAEQQRETPTYLGATAGMRLLRYRHCPAGTARPARRSCSRGWRWATRAGARGCCPAGPWPRAEHPCLRCRGAPGEPLAVPRGQPGPLRPQPGSSPRGDEPLCQCSSRARF